MNIFKKKRKSSPYIYWFNIPLWIQALFNRLPAVTGSTGPASYWQPLHSSSLVPFLLARLTDSVMLWRFIALLSPFPSKPRYSTRNITSSIRGSRCRCTEPRRRPTRGENKYIITEWRSWRGVFGEPTNSACAGGTKRNDQLFYFYILLQQYIA